MSDELRGDKEVVMAAIKNENDFLKSLRNDQMIDFLNLKSAAIDLLAANDGNIVGKRELESAANNNGGTLRLVSNELKNDRGGGISGS